MSDSQRNTSAADSIASREDAATPELSPSAAALLDAILRHEDALRSVEPEPLSIRNAVGYLCGALTPLQQHDVERALVRNAACRGLLRQTLPHLRACQALSWQQAAQRAKEPDLAGQVARVWVDLLGERVSELPDALERAQTWDWTRLREEAAGGIREAQAAWAAFLAFGRQMIAESSRPRMAVVKNAAASLPVVSLSALLPADGIALSAHILRDDSLVVGLSLSGLSPKQRQALGGHAVHVALTLHGEAWPLGSISLADGDNHEASLTVPGFGAAWKLPPGSLPAAWFGVSLDAPFMAPPAPADILAERCDADGHVVAAPPIPIQVAQPLQWQRLYLIVHVSIAPLTRAALADYALELELQIGPGQAQSLGTWQVSEWEEGAKTLRIFCPGSPPAAVLPASFLAARFRAPVAS